MNDNNGSDRNQWCVDGVPAIGGEVKVCGIDGKEGGWCILNSWSSCKKWLMTMAMSQK